MKQFIWTLPGNLVDCFKGRLIVWHAAAILLTVALVLSGFDQLWFVSTRSQLLRAWMFPAVRIGWYLPMLLPVSLLLVGFATRSARTSRLGWAIGQAEIIGGLIAAFYKALTGRTHPPYVVDLDMSRVFRFGFLRGGVFWGWPSSHTTIAFAMAVTVILLCPRQKWLGWLAIIYAFYIGVGVSLTIHWFSDFSAGAIFGSVVGVVVAKSFSASQERSEGAAAELD